MALCGEARFDEARLVLREASQHIPHYPPTLAAYCASLAETDRAEEAKAIADKMTPLGGVTPVLAILQHEPSRLLYEQAYRRSRSE